MKAAKLYLEKHASGLLVKCECEINSRIGFRLFHEGCLIHKIPYGKSVEHLFEVKPSQGLYRAQAYIKNKSGVQKITSNSVRVNSVVTKTSFSEDKLLLSAADLLPEFYSIIASPCLDDEIDSFYKNGFSAYGRPELKRWKITLPYDWSLNPYTDRNWMFQLHAWRMLDPFLLRFNKEDILFVSELINDWLRFDQNIKESEDYRFFWYDMSAGLRALKLSYFVLRCSLQGIEHGIAGLPELLVKHIRFLSDKNNLSKTNHGIFQLNGLMALIHCMTKEAVELKGIDISLAYNFAINEMSKLLFKQFTTNGIHTENSPDYHFFVYKTAIKVLAAPWWQGPHLAKVRNVLQKAEKARYWMLTPGHEVVPVGDSSRSKARLDDTGIYSWPHKNIDGIIAASLGGYAVIRSAPETSIKKSSFCFFQASFYSNTHKHSDDLSFVWQESGKYILVDSGKYGYQSDRFRTYFCSSQAHNTIVVDRTSTSKDIGSAYGSALLDAPRYVDGFWLVGASFVEKKLNYIHTRVLVYQPGSRLCVIDKLINLRSDKKARKTDLNWHFDPSFAVSSKSDVVIADNKNQQVCVKFSTSETDFEYALFKGHDVDGELLGWVSNSYLKYEPTTALVFSTKLYDDSMHVTEFQLNAVDVELFTIKDKSLLCKYESLLDSINVLLNKQAVSTGSIVDTDFLSAPRIAYDKEVTHCVASHYNELPYYLYQGVRHFYSSGEAKNILTSTIERVKNRHSSTTTKNLLVTFHGSIKPPRNNDPGTQLPCFRLFDFKCQKMPHILCFSDMLLDAYKDDKVYLGWFLDTKKISQRDKIEKIIRHYVAKHSITNVVLHGSSGGGHVAIDMASRIGGIALVSNCQFILNKHPQYNALAQALDANNDAFVSHDLHKIISRSKGPGSVINYCNTDDYTLRHHLHMESVMNDCFPGVIKNYYFSGDSIAKSRNVKNHSVGYPEGESIRAVLAAFFNYLSS